MIDKKTTWKEASRQGNLSIRGIQRGYGEEDRSEIITTARYVKKDGKRYLFYREYAEDGSHQQVRLTIGEKEVILKKTGLGVSTLHFQKGRSMPCHYQSPVGPMELVSKTRVIHVKEEPHSLRVKMEYALYMHGQHMSDYVLELKWKE